MMDVRSWQLPFRVGATSYSIEDDLLGNARFLAGQVQDMQLVLFDLPGGPSNLPDATTVAALAALGAQQALSYTVHLLDDLAGRPHAPLSPSLRSARSLIEQTRPLAPWAWVGHLDGRTIGRQGADDPEEERWQRQMVAAVVQVCRWAGSGKRLAIENLEGYPVEFVAPVVAQAAAARCVDVGHLWLDGHDPLPALQAAWPWLRVVHLHGVVDDPTEPHRDHRSLAHTDPTQVDRVVQFLLAQNYRGLLTLEVFGENDFRSSLHALHASVDRCREEKRWGDR
ncbi:MAG: cobamide remodeling phosphodiesterase CbiR [Caldilinea sp.]|jgi:sugar phosphate isomerase/epimerase